MWDGKTCYLSDRGIKQAVEQGLLSFNPSLEDRQIQPASIDLLLDEVVDYFPIPEHGMKDWKMPEEDFLIPAHSTAELKSTQWLAFAEALRFHSELRSSLRRLSCYIDNKGATTLDMESQRLSAAVVNPSGIDIKLHSGDKIAQLLFCFNKFPLIGESYDMEYERTYRLLCEVDCGCVVSTREAKRLLSEGYFSMPNAKFWRGMLEVHAGSKARVLRKSLRIDFSNSKDISDAFEDVKLPYLLRPGEHIVVETRENFELSPHIGIHFRDYTLGSRRGFFPRMKCFERMNADFLWLGDIPDGWVDPGYKGILTRQPKTFYEKGVLIRPGQLLGHGTIIFFPNGVERPYGSEGLGSHYQNSKDINLVQNK